MLVLIFFLPHLWWCTLGLEAGVVRMSPSHVIRSSMSTAATEQSLFGGIIHYPSHLPIRSLTACIYLQRDARYMRALLLRTSDQ
jgi:hypothetical protein